MPNMVGKLIFFGYQLWWITRWKLRLKVEICEESCAKEKEKLQDWLLGTGGIKQIMI